MVKTLCFHCRGQEFYPWLGGTSSIPGWGTKIPQALAQPKRKRKKGLGLCTWQGVGLPTWRRVVADAQGGGDEGGPHLSVWCSALKISYATWAKCAQPSTALQSVAGVICVLQGEAEIKSPCS